MGGKYGKFWECKEIVFDSDEQPFLFIKIFCEYTYITCSGLIHNFNIFPSDTLGFHVFNLFSSNIHFIFLIYIIRVSSEFIFFSLNFILLGICCLEVLSKPYFFLHRLYLEPYLIYSCVYNIS